MCVNVPSKLYSMAFVFLLPLSHLVYVCRALHVCNIYKYQSHINVSPLLCCMGVICVCVCFGFGFEVRIKQNETKRSIHDDINEYY